MDEIVSGNDVSLYESDSYAWTQQQAALLRKGQLDALDLVNVLEEIETLGRKEVAELRSRYVVLALNLLKLIVQPKRATRSWQAKIVEQRIRIASPLRKIRASGPNATCYSPKAMRTDARFARRKPRLRSTISPKHPPFTVEEAEDETRLPASPVLRS